MNPTSENNKKLKEFFSEEYSSLKAYVNSRIKASANRDAEDIIQEVALKLFTGADRYSPINNVAGFVYYSIKNKIVDIMRKNKQTSFEYNQNKAKEIDLTEDFYDSSEAFYSEEMKDELRKVVLSLKPVYRDIIIAVDFEGYTYNTISIETGIPIGTLMSRRHRAISLLHKKLESIKEKIN